MQRRSLASQSLDGVDSCFIIRALLGNSELLSLQKYWSVRVELLPKHGLVAYDFVYDPEGRELTIAPNYGSTDPADYPNQLTRTSELFSFLAAHLQSTIAIVDLKTVLQSYPLSKLTLQLLDDRSFTIENIRIDVADREQWDYINPVADREFGKVIRHRDFSG
jgi:hypothetical protein